MDYLHYRYKNWKPFEYMSMPAGQKRVARAYMQQEIKDRNARIENIENIFG
ncbi:MAG: hypothetical protein K1W24_06645 [Lachnospiraceae bacterium]